MESPSDTSPSNHVLFTYGTLKREFHNHHLLRGSEYIDDATLTGTMRSLGGFPCVSLNGDYQIHGELFKIDDATLAACDRLEGHPNFYERKMVETNKGPCWAYIIEDERYLQYPVVKSGIWYDMDFDLDTYAWKRKGVN